MSDGKSIEKLFSEIGKFDALISAAGLLALAPLKDLSEEHWDKSIQGKLLGQVNLALKALPYIKDNGSITLISGVDAVTAGGIVASVVNRGIEAFVSTSAKEMPRGIRINAVSPGLLSE